VQLILGHASAAMTLDIYAGLFADDLDAVADRLRAFVKLNADQMRTKRRTSRSDQTELPFENPPEQGTG
jgi:integrase